MTERRNPSLPARQMRMMGQIMDHVVSSADDGRPDRLIFTLPQDVSAGRHVPHPDNPWQLVGIASEHLRAGQVVVVLRGVVSPSGQTL